MTAGNPVETGLIGQVESRPFVMDTRVTPDNPVETGLIVQFESSAFTLDTRLTANNPVDSGLVVQGESPSFTIDTRLSVENPIETNLVTQTESGGFTLDTRIGSENPPEADLVTRVESATFTLDLRIRSENFDDTGLVTQFVSNTFTLDTQSGWIKTPFRDLAGSGAAGGKLRFSPDGMRLAKADGGRVLLWDLQSPKPGVAMASGGGEVASVEFLPPGDQLLSGTADGTARWWDAVTHAEAGRVTPGASGTAQAASSADGAKILAGRGTELGLFRATDKALIQELEGLATPLTALALSPDGLLALAASSDRVVTVWDTASGEILHRLTGHQHLITAAAFLPDGTRSFTASLDGTIRVWDLATGTTAFIITQSGQVADAALSADGTLIGSCDTAAPGTAYLWDARDGALKRVFSDTNLDPSPLKGVAISPDHTMLVTSRVDGITRVWDTGLTPQPTQPVTPLAIGVGVPVTLRSHGLYYFEVEAAAGHNLVVTLEAVAAAVPRTRSTKSGLSADAQFANLTATSRAAKSLQKPPTHADVTAFRMTAMRGRLPSAYDYETFAQAPVTKLHCEMPLALTASGKAYVLVYAPQLSAGTISASIRAEYADFHLSDISPARGGNGGNVTARIQGTGITPDTAARLIGPGGAAVAGQLALCGDSTKAWFTFPLTGAATGSYRVELVKVGLGAVALDAAFEVAAGGGPQLQSSLTAPSAVRPGRDYGMTLKYSNVGDADMAAPLFVVSAGDARASIYRTPMIRDLVFTQASGAPNTTRVPQVQVLGVNQEGPPGVLPPGASWEIPLYFQGDGNVWDMAFNLSVLKADATLIDWAAMETRMKPVDMAAELWAVLWSNFKASIGTTWADWLRALDHQAHLFALAGQSVSNPSDLLAALFSQAVGTPYRRTLAAAVDAQAPAPGLPLAFSRFATDGVDQRFSVGPLGRGWSHNFEYALTRPAADEVLIRSPGGGARRFTLGPDSVWHGSTSDRAALTASSGGFTLIEPEGISWNFNSAGQLVAIADPNGNRITLTYTSGNLTGIAHSSGAAFSLEYNPQGRLFRLTDHAGQVTTYQYDPTDERLLHVTAPGMVITDYSYESAPGTAFDHALNSVTFPDLTHQYFAWDSRGRLTEQSRDGGTERLRFAYDASGTVTIRDAQDAVTTLRMGSNGQLLQMVDALGRPVTFGYDANANLTRLTGPAGETTELSYDSHGNAKEIVNPLGQTVTLSHKALGRLGKLSDALGQNTDFGYDPQGNLTEITYADASAEVLATMAPAASHLGRTDAEIRSSSPATRMANRCGKPTPMAGPSTTNTAPVAS